MRRRREGDTSHTRHSLMTSIRACAIPAALALALGAAGPSAAQLAVQQEGAAVHVWSAKARPTRLELPPHSTVGTAVAAEGGVVVAGTDRRSGELFLAHESDGVVTSLPAPRSRGNYGQYRPTLLTTEGRLEAVAWLEGPWEQDAAIHAAAWNGTSWEVTEVVSRRRGAAQLAVTGAVLEDGSWMLLWAGFDGGDDEIFWSRRVDGEWSRPRRLHADNQVPDILPTVVDSDGGALAAWSFYDGNDYRVRTARWDGAAWTVGRPLAGRGALDARWERNGERAYLTYRSVDPEAWILAEADGAGRPRHRALVESVVDERPLVVLKGASPRLAWPWRDRGAAR